MDIIASNKLSAYITNTLKAYDSAGRRIHIAAVSAIAHACVHGDTSLLTRLYEGLRTNDQQALRYYIRRNQIILGLGGEQPSNDADTNNEAHARAQVLDFKKGAFTIVRGPNSDEAKAFATMCADRLINPDGEVDKYVLDRNNMAEQATLGDVDALKKLIKLANETDAANDTEKRKSSVSPTIQKFFKDMGTQAEALLKQVTLAEG